MFLGKVLELYDVAGLILEERTENNKHKSDDELLHLFYSKDVTFVDVTFDELSTEDILWFSLYKPCGGDESVDTIKKPIFEV
jgi:hypothetical protein